MVRWTRRRRPVLLRRRLGRGDGPFADHGSGRPPARVSHGLVRRCVAVVVVYAVIWVLGSVLLEIRLAQTRRVATTFTTVTGSARR